MRKYSGQLYQQRYLIASLVVLCCAIIFFAQRYYVHDAMPDQLTCATDFAQYPAPDVPLGAPHQTAKILRSMPPQGFTAGTGWLTVATATECIAHDAVAQITIKDFSVVAHDADGQERLVISSTQEDYWWDGGIFARFPHWFVTNEYDSGPEFAQNPLYINLAPTTRRITHLWTPRFAVYPDEKYQIVAHVKVDGIARLELGMDYWRNFDVEYNFFDEFCRGTNNCEAWVSDWIGDTEGEFVEVRFPEM